MVGMLKSVRTERVHKMLRIHFVAGWQTLNFFRLTQNAAQETALLVDVGVVDMAEAVTRLQSQLKEAESELKQLRQMKMDAEVENLAQFAERVDDKWLATKLFEDRDAGELRMLAMKLRLYPKMVALLASFDGKKLSLVTACADDTDLNASELLRDHLAPFGGRGGGDLTIAQGGGSAENVDELFKHTREMVRNS